MSQFLQNLSGVREILSANQIKSYITKKDFVEEPYAKVAEMLFEQLENGEINPAKIINYFGSEEEQNQVAGLFNANIGADLVREEKIKRLVQAVEKVKANSLDYRSKNETDLKEFLNIQKEKDSFKNVKIKIDLQNGITVCMEEKGK